MKLKHTLTIVLVFVATIALLFAVMNTAINRQVRKGIDRETSTMNLYIYKQMNSFTGGIKDQVRSRINCLYDSVMVYDLCSEIVYSNENIYDMSVEYVANFFPDRYEFMPFWFDNGREIMHGDNIYDTLSVFRDYIALDPIYQVCTQTRQEVWSTPYIETYEFENDVLMDYAFPVFDSSGEVMAVVVITNALSIWEELLSGFKMHEGGHMFLWCDPESVENYSDDKETAEEMMSLRNRSKEDISELLRSVVSTGKPASVINRKGKDTIFYASYIPELKMVAVYSFPAVEYYGDSHRAVSIVILIMLLGFAVVFASYRKLSRQTMAEAVKEKALQNEMSAATAIQKQMLPGEHASICGVQIEARLLPAKAVGGDFYDFLESGGRLCFCIGDVSGKGTPAALLTARALTLFRTIARTDSNPSTIARYLNDNLCEGNDEMMFATMFIGLFDPEARTLTCCNAAHNPSVLWREGKADYLKLESNIPVAIQSGYPFEDTVIQIGEGGRLVAYTDGVTEAMNKEHELYGDDRLLDFCLAQPENEDKLCENLLESVENFVQGFEQSDDITILDLKF